MTTDFCPGRSLHPHIRGINQKGIFPARLLESLMDKFPSNPPTHSAPFIKGVTTFFRLDKLFFTDHELIPLDSALLGDWNSRHFHFRGKLNQFPTWFFDGFLSRANLESLPCPLQFHDKCILAKHSILLECHTIMSVTDLGLSKIHFIPSIDRTEADFSLLPFRKL